MPRYADLSEAERDIVKRNCVRFREELGKELGEELSQAEIAQLSGLSHDSIRNFEQGRRVPDVTSLRRLGQVFGRRVDDFFDENPPLPDPAMRMIAVRAKIIGRLDDDLREQIFDFVAGINHKQLERIKALKDKSRAEQAKRLKEFKERK